VGRKEEKRRGKLVPFRLFLQKATASGGENRLHILFLIEKNRRDQSVTYDGALFSGREKGKNLRKIPLVSLGDRVGVVGGVGGGGGGGGVGLLGGKESTRDECAT